MEIEEPGPPLDESKVSELEEALGVSLPSDYREFLLRFNGGSPAPCDFVVPSHEEELFDIRTLFGVTRPIEVSNVEWNIREYRTECGAELIPIGRTGDNDILLLGIRGHRTGEVLFLDWAEDDLATAVHFVAKSFSEFLAGLTDDS
jgi:hypothetical protein